MGGFMKREQLLLKFFGVNSLEPDTNSTQKTKRSRMTPSPARRPHRRLTSPRKIKPAERFTPSETEPMISEKVLKAQAAILSGKYDSPEILCTALERLLECLEASES